MNAFLIVGILVVNLIFNESFYQIYALTPIRQNRKVLSLRNSNGPSSLGGPPFRPLNLEYLSINEIAVKCEVEEVIDPNAEINHIINCIDDHHGVLLTSSYEYPGRYSRWTVGFVAPPLVIVGKGLDFSIKPLNKRGEVISKIIKNYLEKDGTSFLLDFCETTCVITGTVIPKQQYFCEEERSKQASLFTLIRAITFIFESSDAGQLGLYGSFGYDLAFQFESIKLRKERDIDQRDMVLYFPDQILVVDNQRNDAYRINYEFESKDLSLSTFGLPSEMSISKYHASSEGDKFMAREYPKGGYAENVKLAFDQFKMGNLFEVVLSQSFRHKLLKRPSQVFKRLCRRNPSPYGFYMNLGMNEYLVGASPEMFVRVEKTINGLRVETCPISGTIERGNDALEDAQQIKKLLLSTKEESELTMCTDVDRNDKSRICKPGSVRVIGRRQIELYSKLIHTVDHVEGYLRKEFDALDAFLCHTWAVTVTGAPKTWALRFIENVESTPRRWYGGAVGFVGFDGSLNTGLTLRTVRISDGIADVRAGATLLFDSIPESEELETELKASALIDAITNDEDSPSVQVFPFSNSNAPPLSTSSTPEDNKVIKVLLIDHEDSFVHTLANYVSQSGAEVVTCRSGENFKNYMSSVAHDNNNNANFNALPDLAILSPGPGRPCDFDLSGTIKTLIDHKIPIFGVCLGLQGMVEYFGGSLNVLDYPMHGKPSQISQISSDTPVGTGTDLGGLFDGLPSEFQVARYHSLYADKDKLPSSLRVIAMSSDDCIMAIQHNTLPLAAVQFHPESILTLPSYGLQIISNALKYLKKSGYDKLKAE